MRLFFLLLLLLLGAVFIDETAKEPVFPDPLYCLAGAGTFIYVPESTSITRWRADPGGRDIPNGWTTNPEHVVCVHETVWRGWKKLYEERLEPAFKIPSFSVSAPKVCHAEGTNQLAEWFNRSLMPKPELANGFSRCMDSISTFQENFLKKLDAEASSATSRSVQLSLTERAKTLRSNLEVDQRSACLKVILYSLGTDPETHFKNGPWEGGGRKENVNAPDEVMHLADRKLNDLTPVGRVELTENIAMKADHYLHSYGPNAYLPATYGDKAMGLGPTPLLDRWIEPVSTSMECH